MRIVSLTIIFLSLILVSCNEKKGVKNEAQLELKEEIEIEGNILVAMLDTIWRTEQEPIRLRDSLGKVHGYESVEFKKQNEIYHQNHDINERKIREVLDSQGWPSIRIIGEQGNLTICNVLQHSSIEVRKKRSY